MIKNLVRQTYITAVLMLSTVASVMQAQSTSPLVVEVKAVTGVSTRGLPVELSGEESGWVFDPVKVNDQGIARFAYVPAGVFTLTVDGSSLGLEKYVDRNVVHPAGDTIRVVLKEAVRTPFALTASASHDDFTGSNSATVSWNRETDYFFDDFESYEPFAIEFAPWTGYDMDNEPAAEIMGSYPNRGLRQYATIFNALTIDPPVYYEYEVLRPYSGKQYVGFVRTRSGNANNDWLISPKIKVGVNNIVSFMAKASEYQPDRFAVCISTTGNEIKNFTQLTPGNYQTVDYRQWQEISYNLSQYEDQEVYIAIHCMSQNSFMLMIDDFYVGPADIASNARKSRRIAQRSAANPNEIFQLTLDGNPVGETPEYSYTFENLSGGKHVIGVKAKYLQTESEESTVEIEIPTADNFARVSLSVASDNNSAVSSQIVNLLNVDTARPTSVTTDSEGKAVIASLAKGTYMVNVSSDLYDDYNARVEVNGDTEVEIVLAETVIDPYNLIYQASSADDGSSVVELWWNGDLGFRDSFEDYDDFVQEFGEWAVIDGDRMPTYAFSISGVMVEKPQSRGEVGAMIFNPFATEPIQASMDGLFITPFGNKYVMFNSAEQARSNDWLISPTVKIGSDYVLRFVAKSYDSMYPGSFEICVLKDKNTAAPDVLDAFYLTSDWMQYEISLKAYEGENIELAFHHTTYDGWLSFIDDFYVGPSEDNPDRTGTAGNCTFDVWVDGQYHSNVATPYLKLVNLTAGEHKVGVQAVYASGKKSNVTEITFNVGSGVIEIVADSSASECSEWKIFNLNGQQVVADKLSPGVYIRTNGSRTEKLIIK